jgi:hypothetical protein
MGSISGFALNLDHPERVERHVALGVPPPFIKLSPHLLPAMRHLWFQQALAMPGLGPRLLSEEQQQLPALPVPQLRRGPKLVRPGRDRRLCCPAAGTGTRSRRLSPLWAPGAAGIPAHFPRDLPEDSTAHAYVAALWHSGFRISSSVDNHLLRGNQADADHVEVAFVPGAAHSSQIRTRMPYSITHSSSSPSQRGQADLK